MDLGVHGQAAVVTVDVDDLAARTGGYVGADVAAVCREAAQIAVREYVDATKAGEDRDPGEILLTADHFDRTLIEVDPEERGTFETEEPVVADAP